MAAAWHQRDKPGISGPSLGTFLDHRAIGLHHSRDRLFDGIVAQRGLSYCRPLSGHVGCVNSIAFSHQEGRWLVSGSDDRRVLLWRCLDVGAGGRPAREYMGHTGSVFGVVWTSDNRHIVSCGSEGKILHYDAEQAPAPMAEYHHEDAVRKVSIQAEASNVFISASHDFTLKLWDTRAGTSPQGTIIGLDPFNAVAFSPSNSHLFLSCDGSAVCLWDLRQAFRPDLRLSLEAARQCRQRVLRQYMAVCRHHSGLIFLPEISTVAFNRRGTHFVCSAWKAVPLLYSVESPSPLMAFHAEGYSNKVTQKSASFAGSNDELVMCGSDDWGVYMWSTGAAKRQVDNNHHLPRSVQPRRCIVAVAETSDLDERPSQRRVRVQTNAEWAVEGPVRVLRGHQSIVNSVDWNTAEPMVASAGVEKCIRLWSPWPMHGQVNGAEPIRVPARGFSAARGSALQELVTHDSNDPEGASEADTFELFDYYTARMRSDSEGEDGPSRTGQTAAARERSAAGTLEADWETSRSGSDSSSIRAEEDAAPAERYCSSSDSDNDRGDQPRGSGASSDSLQGLPQPPPRPPLSMVFDTAALLQQLSELPSPWVEMPLADSFSPCSPLQAIRRGVPLHTCTGMVPLKTTENQLPQAGQQCPWTALMPTDNERRLESIHSACEGNSPQGCPNIVLRCLERSTSSAAASLTPAEGMKLQTSQQSSSILDGILGQSLCVGLAAADSLLKPPEPEADTDGEVSSASEEDLYGRKRFRSRGGSPDSVNRPPKRCE